MKLLSVGFFTRGLLRFTIAVAGVHAAAFLAVLHYGETKANLLMLMAISLLAVEVLVPLTAMVCGLALIAPAGRRALLPDLKSKPVMLLPLSLGALAIPLFVLQLVGFHLGLPTIVSDIVYDVLYPIEVTLALAYFIVLGSSSTQVHHGAVA